MKSTGYFFILGALAVFAFAPFLLFGQQQKGIQPATQSCAGQNCDSITVDDVSFYGENQVSSITVSGGKGLYVLSCWSVLDDTCIAPAIGNVYEYSEGSPNDNTSHLRVSLAGPGTSSSEYELDVFVPLVPSQRALNLLRTCQSKDRLISLSDCAMWLRRQIAIAKAPCPEPGASTACHSFKELVAAGDAELMDDLATKDHVYACFLPATDEFFEITFSEPTVGGWENPNSEDKQKGISESYLVAFGGTQFVSYKNGLVDPDRTFQEIARWVYLPLGHKNDMSYLAKYATSDTSKFQGEKIQIELGRFDFSEEFKNRRGTQTTHTVSVQLATGRFTEKYATPDSGILLDSVSGRCLIVPNERH